MDVGQTVAASLSAPKLFVIANDLSRMQILASVDESDIGKIEAGQPVTFTVQSFPDRQFTGSVEQVRLNSTTLNNVVSYTAVVSVSNEDGKLLPGMTASVKLVTASADDVLTVPSTALRFTPPEGAKTNTPVRPARPAGDSAAAPSSRGGWSARGRLPWRRLPRWPWRQQCATSSAYHRHAARQHGAALDRGRRRHAHAALREARHLRRPEDADHVTRSPAGREHRDRRDAARRRTTASATHREPAAATEHAAARPGRTVLNGGEWVSG